MKALNEQILRAAKEIVVKYIETGRVSPTAFPETFRSIYDAVYDTVNRRIPLPPAADSTPDDQ